MHQITPFVTGSAVALCFVALIGHQLVAVLPVRASHSGLRDAGLSLSL